MKKVSIALVIAMLLTAVFTLAACGPKEPAADTQSSKEISSESETSSVDEVEVPADEPKKAESEEKAEPKEQSTKNKEATDLPNPVATIEMESGEKIVVELHPEYAPNTVNNFVTLSQKGFYDGVIFHRIVPSFVIQGGDPTGTGMGGPGYSIKGEFINNGFDENRLSHTRGVISMARSQDKDSGGSQFFIVIDDANGKHLDKEYAGFGIVTEGMDVVDQIAAVERDSNDKPIEPVVIKTITIDTKGVENWPEPETM